MLLRDQRGINIWEEKQKGLFGTPCTWTVQRRKNTIRPRGLNATNIPKLKRATGFANHSCDSIPRIKVTMAPARKKTEERKGRQYAYPSYIHTLLIVSVARRSNASTSDGLFLFLPLSMSALLYRYAIIYFVRISYTKPKSCFLLRVGVTNRIIRALACINI